jgi:hypothetical protein
VEGSGRGPFQGARPALFGKAEIIHAMPQECLWGTQWRSWLHCATSQKVAGSIPDGITGFFY